MAKLGHLRILPRIWPDPQESFSVPMSELVWAPSAPPFQDLLHPINSPP